MIHSLFKPNTRGSKATAIGVTRAARDALFAAYEYNRENSELIATFPAENRPKVNPLPTPDVSIPTGNPYSPTEAWKEFLFWTVNSLT